MICHCTRCCQCCPDLRLDGVMLPSYNSTMQFMFKPFKLDPPHGESRVLLHSCCAPCTGVIIELFIYSKINFTLFFYNPNIHPRREYELRKEQIIRFAKKKNIPFVDAGYDPKDWLKRIKGLEQEPERGKRCNRCFDIRLELAALYAHEHDFKIFTTSCGIAPWKNIDQVHSSGINAAQKYPGLIYWNHNWRKKGGAQGMYQVSKKEGFYKQEYCGCIYSFIATNKLRQENGQDRIVLGSQYYK